MRVEFYGIPRQRTGTADCEVTATTVAALRAVLLERFPALADSQNPQQWPAAFILNLNGDCFLSAANSDTPLAANDVVLVMSADAGGV